jgi:hypothetical protein
MVGAQNVVLSSLLPWRLGLHGRCSERCSVESSTLAISPSDQVAGELSMRASEQCPCHHSFKRPLTHPISFTLSSSFDFWQDRNGKVIF